MDFGIAKIEASLHSPTTPGEFLGTPLYMAPEQANGGAITNRTDIFSLGAIGFTLLTGRPAFLGDTVARIIMRVVAEDPGPLRSSPRGSRPSSTASSRGPSPRTPRLDTAMRWRWRRTSRPCSRTAPRSTSPETAPRSPVFPPPSSWWWPKTTLCTRRSTRSWPMPRRPRTPSRGPLPGRPRQLGEGLRRRFLDAPQALPFARCAGPSRDVCCSSGLASWAAWP